MRLHKALANAGIGSRRTIESWIKARKIKVNGKCASIGQVISLNDQVSIDGKRVSIKERFTEESKILIYHKPEGEICANVFGEGKKSVFANLAPVQKKWIMVGRLDVNTSGLLLFTNNGEWAHRLMHPRFGLERQYAVRVRGQITQETLNRLKKGIHLEEGIASFKEIQARPIKPGANQWFTVTLMRGKYREVRRLWDSVGCTVSRLIRIKYGNIKLPRTLKKGCWEILPSQKGEELMSLTGPD